VAFEFARCQDRRVPHRQVALFLIDLFLQPLVIRHLALFKLGKLFLRVSIGIVKELCRSPSVIGIRLCLVGLFGVARLHGFIHMSGLGQRRAA